MNRVRIVALAAAALFALPVFAQNNQLAGGGVMDGVSSNYIISMFASAGVNARYLQFAEGTHYIEVREEDTVAFVGLRACDGEAPASLCGMVQPFTIFNGTGLTLAVANQFNLEQSELATTMLLPDDTALVGAKFLIAGGVTDANLRNNIGRYFLDVAKFIDAVKAGAVAQVSFKGPAPTADFIDLAAGLAALEAKEKNVLGRGAPAARAIGEKLGGEKPGGEKLGAGTN